MLMFATFIYGALFVGVPYQDPTPEMSAAYGRRMDIFSAGFLLGSGIAALGLFALMVRSVARWVNLRASS